MARVLHDNVFPEVEVTQPEGQVRARTKLSQRGVSFTVEEDNLLVSGWLNISIDAIRGTDQKSTQLWIRIHDYFNTYKNANWPERSVGSLTNRWSTIQKATNKFCGFLAQVESMHPSGTNEQDKIDKAKALYRSTQKSNYNLDHCWNLLRHQPKWQVHMDNLPTKRKTGCPTVPATIAIDVEENESMSTNLERPLGKKSEKQRERKRKHEKSCNGQFDEKLSNMEADRRLMMIERRETAMKAEKDRAEIISLKKKKMEMEVMMLNVDNMNAVQREYFKSIQIEILEKHRTELNEMQ
ncbi:glutathione S-transferase T3-like [Carya illinoinensis]|uniref:No apical meristem-associated C-terminal domain-containing protein n=1 Tax=Carya illinoinensis TaxID=32201 RepID=A0A8T1QIP6_CARIL|nr:glutathione S-transferase T3-like [Carya illinoinensis]KAG6654179.1 hypothetical protein CIPAW_05G126800 [Carya illinoinensis]